MAGVGLSFSGGKSFGHTARRALKAGRGWVSPFQRPSVARSGRCQPLALARSRAANAHTFAPGLLAGAVPPDANASGLRLAPSVSPFPPSRLLFASHPLPAFPPAVGRCPSGRCRARRSFWVPATRPRDVSHLGFPSEPPRLSARPSCRAARLPPGSLPRWEPHGGTKSTRKND